MRPSVFDFVATLEQDGLAGLPPLAPNVTGQRLAEWWRYKDVFVLKQIDDTGEELRHGCREYAAYRRRLGDCRKPETQ